MRFLLVGKKMSDAVGEAVKRHEHVVVTPAEAGLEEGAALAAILETARVKQLEILTNDSALVDYVYQADLWFNRVIVFLQLPGGDVEQDDAIDRLFKRYKRLTAGRLYSITESRVKVRQLPTQGVKSPGQSLFKEVDE